MSFETKYLYRVMCLLVLIVIAGHSFNLFYLKKEVKGLYEYGLYKPQMVNTAKMRWIDKDLRKKVVAKTEYFGFSMYAEPENLSSGILEIKIYVNNKLIDQITWEKSGTKHRYYHLRRITGSVLKIRISASDSYNPYKLGISKNIKENRNQIAAISDISFFSKKQFKKTMNCNSGN